MLDLNAQRDPSPREQDFVERVLDKTCRGVQVQQVIYGDAVSDPCNVIYMELVEAPTLRFFFDGGVFFWREEEPSPVPACVGFHYRVLRPEGCLVLNQQRIRMARFAVLSQRRRILALHFETGVGLYLQNAADRNTLVIGQGPSQKSRLGACLT